MATTRCATTARSATRIARARVARSTRDARCATATTTRARCPGGGGAFAFSTTNATRATRVMTRGTEERDEGSSSNWEDLFEQFERQNADAEAAQAIPRHKTRALERALARGRRKVEVRELCRELELERHEVLGWLKRNGHRAETLATKFAEELVQEDEAAAAAAAEREARAQAKAKREAADEAKGHGARGPGGMPAYKSYKKTRLGSSNVATLEKVYAMTQYPDDALIESVRQATKLPASKIITWFQERRRGASPSAMRRDRGDANRQVDRRGTTGGYSYTRRDERDEGRGLRRGDARDEYGGGGGERRGRDDASDWSPN